MSPDGSAPPELSRPQARINLRPLADPLPLGLYSFGIGMVVLGAQSAQWIPVRESEQIGLILASFVFPLEGVAMLFAVLARDTLAATVLGLFSTSWLTIGVTSIVGPAGTSSVALGFYLFAFAAAVYTLGIVALSGKPLIGVTLLLSATRAVLDGLYQVSGATGPEQAAGYLALAVAAVAWYAGTGFLLEDLRQSQVLPVARRGAGQAAMDGDLAGQVRRAAREAGVRRQL